MRKKIIIIIIAAFFVTAFGGFAALAYVLPSEINGSMYDHARAISADTERFKNRKTFTITRIDVERNRITVLFDVEYFLKMDERKHFTGGSTISTGISRLMIGWANDDRLMWQLRDLGPTLIGGQNTYKQHAVIDDSFDYHGDAQILDMVEVELPLRMVRSRLTDNKYGMVYYYLEALGFYTDGFIDYSSCFRNGYRGAGDECELVIVKGEGLEYVPQSMRETYERDFRGSIRESEEDFEVPTTGAGMESEIWVIEESPEAPEPDAGPEVGPEAATTEVFEPDAEPEPVFEAASAPTYEEITEPENDKLALELGVVALATEDKPTGGEAAVKETVIEALLAPNTGHKKREMVWEFLVLPLVGMAILAVWWFWPIKKRKKVKKSSKKGLTFFANSDKMVTVY